MKRSFDRYDASLHNQRFYDTGERVYAHSTTEVWKQYTDYGSLNKTLHLHLYRFLKPMELRWRASLTSAAGAGSENANNSSARKMADL